MGRYTQGMVAAALAGSVAGCAAFQSFQPAAADSCRDSATGRFVSCGSGGGDSTGVLVAAGVVLGLAAVGGIIYLAARSPSQGVAPDATRPATAPELELVDPPRDVDPRHLCDGPDGFARVTPLTCGEHGYAYHEGPPRPTGTSRPSASACCAGGASSSPPATRAGSTTRTPPGRSSGGRRNRKPRLTRLLTDS